MKNEDAPFACETCGADLYIVSADGTVVCHRG